MFRRAGSLRILRRKWLARFGEPPPILTDPKLMLPILNGAGDGPGSPRGEMSGDADQAPSRLAPPRRGRRTDRRADGEGRARVKGGGWPGPSTPRAGLGVVACFAFCAGIFSGGAGRAEEDGFVPFERHMGEFACDAWPSAESFERLPKAALLNWILGYLSRAALADRADLLATVDQSRVSAWMDTYCQAHPTDTVAQGANTLERELQSRQGRAR